MADGTTIPQDFYDLGINVEGGGNMLAPRISRSDFVWQDAEGDPTMEITSGSGGDGGYSTEWRSNPNYRAAGYYLSPEAKARLGQWTKNDSTSISWGGGGGTDRGSTFDQYFSFNGGAPPSNLTRNNQGEWGTWSDMGDNAVWQPWTQPTNTREAADKAFNDFWNQQSISGLVKTGDKSGTGVQWIRQGDSFVPVNTKGGIGWDTNPDHSQAIGAFAGLASLGLAAPAMMANGLAGQIGTGLGLANFATGGQVPYLKEISSIANLAGNVGNLATNGINSLSDIGKLVGTGVKAYGLGQNLFGDEPQSNTPQRSNTNMIPPQTGVQNVPGGAAKPASVGFTGATDDGSNTTSSGFDWGNLWDIITGGAGGGRTGLADIWGAIEGSRQAKDQGLKLQQWYSDELGRRQPYLDRLNASYTDPNTFYDSNQWKGLASVYKNSIDRDAARGGTLSNPTAREVLLQNHAMKSLEDYRRGLTSAAGVINPNAALNAATRGAELEARANNPYLALAGRGGVGGPGLNGGQGGIGSVINDIIRSAGGIQNLPDGLRRILQQIGGDGSNPNHGGTFETDYPYEESTSGMGSANPDEYGINEPTGSVSIGDIYETSGYGSDTYGDVTPNWNDPNFDPFSGNADYDISDTSFFDDIGSWFDW